MEAKEAFLERYDSILADAGEALRCAAMAERMYALCAYLDEERQKYNLTAIKDPAEVMSKHVYDCLTAMQLIIDHASDTVDMDSIAYLDVGSGAGFPALPAAALLLGADGGKADNNTRGSRGSAKVKKCRSAEASLKKCGFMNRAAALMGLNVASEDEEQGFLALQARAEALGRDAKWRETQDIVTARAVADLPILMELCLPLTRTGGIFAAMKGSAAEDELSRAGNAARALGAVFEAEKRYSLPDGAGERSILIFRKRDKTASKYPRSYGKITAKPL